MSLLWASPREILNVRQADDLGVDIITVTHDMLAKLRCSARTSRSTRSTRSRCSTTTPASAEGRPPATSRPRPLPAWRRPLRSRNDWSLQPAAYGGGCLGQPRQHLPPPDDPAAAASAASPAGSTVLDIGSGQGEFATQLQSAVPGPERSGVSEYSAEGVGRGHVCRGAEADGRPPGSGRWTCSDPLEFAEGRCWRVCAVPLGGPGACRGPHDADPLNARHLLAPGCLFLVVTPRRWSCVRRSTNTSGTSSISPPTSCAPCSPDRWRTRSTAYCGPDFPFFNLYKLAVIARRQAPHHRRGAQSPTPRASPVAGEAVAAR